MEELLKYNSHYKTIFKLVSLINNNRITSSNYNKLLGKYKFLYINLDTELNKKKPKNKNHIKKKNEKLNIDSSKKNSAKNLIKKYHQYNIQNENDPKSINTTFKLNVFKGIENYFRTYKILKKSNFTNKIEYFIYLIFILKNSNKIKYSNIMNLIKKSIKSNLRVKNKENLIDIKKTFKHKKNKKSLDFKKLYGIPAINSFNITYIIIRIINTHHLNIFFIKNSNDFTDKFLNFISQTKIESNFYISRLFKMHKHYAYTNIINIKDCNKKTMLVNIFLYSSSKYIFKNNSKLSKYSINFKNSIYDDFINYNMTLSKLLYIDKQLHERIIIEYLFMFIKCYNYEDFIKFFELYYLVDVLENFNKEESFMNCIDKYNYSIEIKNLENLNILEKKDLKIFITSDINRLYNKLILNLYKLVKLYFLDDLSKYFYKKYIHSFLNKYREMLDSIKFYIKNIRKCKGIKSNLYKNLENIVNYMYGIKIINPNISDNKKIFYYIDINLIKKVKYDNNFDSIKYLKEDVLCNYLMGEGFKIFTDYIKKN